MGNVTRLENHYYVVVLLQKCPEMRLLLSSRAQIWVCVHQLCAQPIQCWCHLRLPLSVGGSILLFPILVFLHPCLPRPSSLLTENDFTHASFVIFFSCRFQQCPWDHNWLEEEPDRRHPGSSAPQGKDGADIPGKASAQITSQEPGTGTWGWGYKKMDFFSSWVH